MKLKTFDAGGSFGDRWYSKAFCLESESRVWTINNVEVLIIQFINDKTFSIVANDADDDVRFTSIGPFKSLESAAVVATLLSSK